MTTEDDLVAACSFSLSRSHLLPLLLYPLWRRRHAVLLPWLPSLPAHDIYFYIYLAMFAIELQLYWNKSFDWVGGNKGCFVCVCVCGSECSWWCCWCCPCSQGSFSSLWICWRWSSLSRNATLLIWRPHCRLWIYVAVRRPVRCLTLKYFWKILWWTINDECRPSAFVLSWKSSDAVTVNRGSVEQKTLRLLILIRWAGWSRPW